MPSESERLAHRLADIVDNIDLAVGIAADLTKERFLLSPVAAYAAIRALEIISEASRHIPEDIKSRHPEIDWRAVRDAGNVYRHAYPVVSFDAVWETVSKDLPPLRQVAHAELVRMGYADMIGTRFPFRKEP